MTEAIPTIDTVRQLIVAGGVRISEHGYDELSEDDVFVRDLIDGIIDARVIEDYLAKAARCAFFIHAGLVMGFLVGFTSPRYRTGWG